MERNPIFVRLGEEEGGNTIYIGLLHAGDDYAGIIKLDRESDPYSMIEELVPWIMGAQLGSEANGACDADYAVALARTACELDAGTEKEIRSFYG